MPDRLADLRRQRALVQEQLAWLDREIAALNPPAPGTPAAPSMPHAAPAPVFPTDPSEYHPDPASAQSNARRGCLMYTVLALVLLAAAMAAIYFLAYRDHPLFFVSDRPAATTPAPR